ncbi:MAG: hypothetical protein ABJN26_14195 [Stappiaceae bacterium]
MAWSSLIIVGKYLVWRLSAVLFTLILPAVAHACMTSAGTDLRDIFSAKAVVVGKVSKYEIVGDARRTIRNYARFEIETKEVLYGEAATSLVVTWDNSTFAEPETIEMEDNYIFALRDPKSPGLPLRGTSATIFPNPEPDKLTILQAPCAGPFIFPNKGNVARAIRLIFDGEGDPRLKADVLARFLGMAGDGRF